MKNNPVWACPVCSLPLVRHEKNYACRKGHSFDIAKEGYVNLILPNQKRSKEPGDTREMIASRRKFFDRGYYAGISACLNQLVTAGIQEQQGGNMNILDVGCGEGYYMYQLREKLKAEHPTAAVRILGIDVSPHAVQYAARRDKETQFAVASAYHLPILPESIDYLVCAFAPRNEEGFRKCLKPSGKVVVLAPGPGHLLGLKEALYDRSEPIGQKGTLGKGFKLLQTATAAYEIDLDSAEDISDLVSMTPYIRHTSPEALEALKKLHRLRTGIEVNLFVYGRG